MARKRRRARGEGSLYRRADGVWVGVLPLPRGHDGRRRRHFVYGPTQRAVLDKMEAAKADWRAGRMIDPNRVTVADFATAWLGVVKIRPSTKAHYDFVVQKHIKERVGGETVQRFQKIHARQLFARMAEDGVGLHTQRLAFTVLRKMFRDAVRDDLISRSPMEGMRAPEVPQEPRAILDPETQLPVLLAAAERNEWIGALVTLLAYTGLRLGEALGLRWKDLDLRAGTVRVERTSVDIRGKLSIQDTKTRAGRREVTLPQRAIAAMERHRAKLGALPHPDRAVFAERDGELMPRTTIYRAWRKLLRDAKLPAVTPHSLRHVHSIVLLRAGTPPHIVAGRLGHANPTVTLNIYSRWLPADDAALAAKLDKLLG